MLGALEVLAVLPTETMWHLLLLLLIGYARAYVMMHAPPSRVAATMPAAAADAVVVASSGPVAAVPAIAAAAASARARAVRMGRSRAKKVFQKKEAKAEALEVSKRAAPPLPPAAELPPPPPPPPPEEEVNPGAVPGTALRILEYPHPLLRAPNAEVRDFDAGLQRLAKEMFSIMYASRGVGLAAPQLGINQRLMVFNPEGRKEKWLSEVVLCNPRIVDSGPGGPVEVEGCLSFPGFTADVERAGWIKVEYQDAKGKVRRKKLVGWEARIFQHEYDHLDGVLYVDRLSEAERSRVQPELDQLIAAHGPGGAE